MTSVAGVVRGRDWWYSKLPPLLGLALVQVLRHDLEPGRALLLVGSVLFVTGASVGAWGHVLNDACDVVSDQRVGKPNRMARFRPATRAAIAALFPVTALAPALAVGYGRTATLLLVLELLLPALYALPPVRLKERGVAGVLADAAAAHVVPAWIVLATFAGGRPESPALVVVVTVWASSVGLAGILWHQRRDREDDLAAGARTFAATADPALVRTALERLLHPLEVAAFVALVVLLAPVSRLLVAAFVLFLALDLAKLALGWGFVFDPGHPEHRRPHLPLVSNAFYELWFPLAAAIELSFREPVFAVFAVLLVVAFFRNLRDQAADLAALGRDLLRRLAERPRPAPEPLRRRGWRLELFGGSAARLLDHPARRDACRLEIDAPGALNWHVKLSRPPVALARGAAYELRAELRADRERAITWCVVRGREPWDALGLSEGMVVGPAWRSVVLRFAASDDDTGALPCLLVGGEETPVELGPVQFLPMGSRP